MHKPTDNLYYPVVVMLCPQRFWQLVKLAETEHSDVLSIMHRAINVYAHTHYQYNVPEAKP